MLYRLKEREPAHLNDKPTHCHWCTGMLRGLRNIYKGQYCSRHYCSEGCLRADSGSLDSGVRSYPGQASEHDSDHGESDEGNDGAGVSLEVASEPAVTTDPG